MGNKTVKKKLSVWKRFKSWLRNIPHLFAKVVIVHCIAVVTVAAFYSLRAQKNGAEMTALFKAVGYFFITELAFLFGKTIWNNRWKRDKKEENEYED